jgi:hypothetical protein
MKAHSEFHFENENMFLQKIIDPFIENSPNLEICTGKLAHQLTVRLHCANTLGERKKSSV